MNAKRLRIITSGVIDERKAAERLSDIAGIPRTCPECGSPNVPAGYFSGRFVRCSRCGKKFTWRTGSVFEGTKLSAARLLCIFDSLSLGLSDNETASSAEVSADTVRLWRFKYGLTGFESREAD